MAKSIRITEIDAPPASLGAPLSHSAFWEHWFDSHAHNLRPQLSRPLDEHSIWEKAVNLEILAIDDDKKY
jgi:hypothetical protein